MISLHTNTVTKLFKVENRLRFMRVLTTGTVNVRLGLSEDMIELSPGGFQFNNSESILAAVPANQQIFGVAGTLTTLSIAEEPVEYKVLGVNPIRLG